MKHFFLLISVFLFSSALMQAQNKKLSKSAPAKKQQAAPIKVQKAQPSGAPSENSLSNSIISENAEKIPPYRPNLLKDSLMKFIPDTEEGIAALRKPFIILAPAESDQEAYNIFTKLVAELVGMKGARNTPIMAENGQTLLALAVNNPAAIELLQQSKNYLGLRTFTFSSTEALAASTDPFVKRLNKKHELPVKISKQNTGYLPVSSDIEGEVKLAP
jgi:hypothetical protein